MIGEIAAMADQSALVAAADGALYRTKRHGRDRVEVASSRVLAT